MAEDRLAVLDMLRKATSDGNVVAVAALVAVGVATSGERRILRLELAAW